MTGACAIISSLCGEAHFQCALTRAELIQIVHGQMAKP
ncbi:hypothetical protein SAMN05660745_01605 [Corynebacterium glucuronolyticum]|nr:hypothetical protein CGLUCO_08040 [Corynebacterium glucuronolyticum DSM 44120]SMB86133.1 hypothetical protein SAMN05660745_01605 [Corynebacterium glucuronolyticum]